MNNKLSVQKFLEHILEDIDRFSICVEVPLGHEISVLEQFCCENFGEPYLHWCHLNHTSLWFFANTHDASAFLLTWN